MRRRNAKNRVGKALETAHHAERDGSEDAFWADRADTALRQAEFIGSDNSLKALQEFTTSNLITLQPYNPTNGGVPFLHNQSPSRNSWSARGSGSRHQWRARAGAGYDGSPCVIAIPPGSSNTWRAPGNCRGRSTCRHRRRPARQHAAHHARRGAGGGGPRLFAGQLRRAFPRRRWRFTVCNKVFPPLWSPAAIFPMIAMASNTPPPPARC